MFPHLGCLTQHWSTQLSPSPLSHLPISLPHSQRSHFSHLPFSGPILFQRKMPINKNPSTPPPMIGKIGPYTVFVTPPSTPTPTEPPVFESPKKVVVAPPPSAPARRPPPVQPPPQQFDKSFVASHSDASVLGFFKTAAFKVQNAHSSLDDLLARWFGLNQSKYQWALDDYYESNGLEKEGVKVKEISSKIQSV